MPFNLENERAIAMRRELQRKVVELWGVGLERFYPAIVVRMGLGPTLELTPCLRNDEKGEISLLSQYFDEGESLVIGGGNLYCPEGEGESINFTRTFRSRVMKAIDRSGENEDQIKRDSDRITALLSSRLRADYLFDCLPALGIHSRAYIVTFPHLAWMNEEALLVVYSFLLDQEKMKEISLGGLVPKEKSEPPL
jgi:hypothetical protein